MSRVYDCFCYYNEDLLLEMRLAILWEVVDVFVISEANYSHKGVPRALHFDPKRFEAYAGKIRYLPLTERPPGANDFWKNENFIRNNLDRGLHDARPDDLVLISDLDEIPNPAAVRAYDRRRLRGDFQQRYYSYFLNNLWIGDVDRSGRLVPGSNVWLGSKITTFEHYVRFFGRVPTSVRSYKSSGLLRSIKRSWFRAFEVQLLSDGGWHFTWMYDVPGIIDKLENTAHQEFNRANLKDPEYIRAMILGGRDFHKPMSRYRAQPIDEQFPSFLREHRAKYERFFLPVDPRS